MAFIISTMRQICLLVAMLMMCSVSGRGSDNLREAAETEPTMDDNTNNVRRQDTTVCGRRQIPTSKRDEGIGASNDDDHSDHLDKLLGGSGVTYGHYPWVVNIYRFRERVCSGAIISEFWIITAASCLDRYRRLGVKLVAGDHRLSRHHESQQIFNVQRRVFHPLSTPNATENDIMLIKVEHKNGSGIRFNNYVQPICLPVAGESIAANGNLAVSGLGHNRTGLSPLYYETIPHYILPVFFDTQCFNESLPGLVADRIQCEGRFTGEFDKCLSEFGAPVTYKSGDTHILAGIIIEDFYCRPFTGPASLTNILAFQGWIRDRINEFSNARQRVIPPRAD